MNTEKIDCISKLKKGDKLVLTSRSYVEAELSMYSPQDLDFLAKNVSFGEIIQVAGISSEETVMAIFNDGSILEIKPFIFEKIVEENKDEPIHKLGYSIWRTYSKDKSIDSYWGFIEDLNEHGLQLAPTVD